MSAGRQASRTAHGFHDACLAAAGGGGEPPRSSPSRLGHSSVAFTLDTYAHVMPGMQPEAAELFRQLVFEDEIQDEIEDSDDQQHGEESDE
jgi:integrase